MISLGLLVSGHGEVEAIPVLVRRLLEVDGIFGVKIDSIRKPESTLLKVGDQTLENQVQRLRAAHDAVLVLIDLEDDCPKETAPLLQERVEKACADKPCYVVCAYRELETWFMWDAQNLLKCDPHPDPERIRGAKEWLKKNGLPRYNEVADSPKLCARMDVELVKRQSDSFRVFVDRISRLARVLCELNS